MLEHDAHNLSSPFVSKLVDFIRRVGTSAETSHVKVVAVCFGHQIIAMAMGGECVKGTNGWEAGVYKNTFLESGRYWWTGDVDGEGGSDGVVRSFSLETLSMLTLQYIEQMVLVTLYLASASRLTYSTATTSLLYPQTLSPSSEQSDTPTTP